MSVKFQINDPSLESQWRAIILFGKNSATYKFAFAKALLEIIEKEKTTISLDELAIPFSKNIVSHLRLSDKQGNSQSSQFLNSCRKFVKDEVTESNLIETTIKLGFVNVVDAFQNVNGDVIPNPFYEKNYVGGKKEIIITDNLLKLKEMFQYQNFEQEVEARWNLVETAWNLKINPNLLEVKYDEDRSLFFIENDFMRRYDITSVRDSLNGYQKGKCFYSSQDISILKKDPNICQVDHFLPHLNKIAHSKNDANINGVWNLVLADSSVNSIKSARIPERRFLERLFNRNEFYIESKHPLAETIINQTGRNKEQRRLFLEKQYNIALANSIHIWKPENELIGNF
ncbi:HNH endonuclease [Flavobacterium sp. F-380]|uniref:HNH endonuclease n=1 Tax=Flavobacterium kayseriense TaxID=2764714 RepID=A0ABR7JAS2_9FLAO|nr:HNH endonuclease domain-containing protein [Flavobacterium kayseriense]MBC5842636.1 HNH endonuclease [Flavobacterium kayseriense]MBC5849166.1 HNH endonuclease [Flavobacterium kayseriense]